MCLHHFHRQHCCCWSSSVSVWNVFLSSALFLSLPLPLSFPSLSLSFLPSFSNTPTHCCCFYLLLCLLDTFLTPIHLFLYIHHLLQVCYLCQSQYAASKKEKERERERERERENWKGSKKDRDRSRERGSERA